MPNYDYECVKCGKVFEVFHSMRDDPEIYCSCGNSAIQLLSSIQTSKDKLWDFTDYHITGKPVRIRTKKQWKAFLKAHNKHDDVSLKSMEIIAKKHERDIKDRQRKEIHEALTSNWQDIKARQRSARHG